MDNNELIDTISKAMRTAWQLGQTYWRQADSDFTSDHRRSDETQRKYDMLVQETIASLSRSQDELEKLLPGPYYMDSPDGGDVTIMEQLRRMADDAAKWREHERSQDVARVAETGPNAFDWLETEITAVDCWHRGDPSYEHDAHWMKDKVLKLIGDARKVFSAPQPPQAGASRNDWQHKALDHGFQYWRASDAHGVEATKAQAVELLQDLLGVEVEINDNGCQTCDGSGQIGGPSYYAPDEGGVPCPDCAPTAPSVLSDEQIEDARRLSQKLRFIRDDHGCHFDDCEEAADLLANIAAAAPAAPAVAPAIAAIEYALEADEGIEFLRVWLHGQFDVIRDEWPDAPQSVYIAAPAPAEPKGEQCEPLICPTCKSAIHGVHTEACRKKAEQQDGYARSLPAGVSIKAFRAAYTNHWCIFIKHPWGQTPVAVKHARDVNLAHLLSTAKPEQRVTTLSDEQRSAIEAAILISEDIQAGRHDGAFLTDASVQALRALISTRNGGSNE